MYVRIANPPLNIVEKYHESQREFYFMLTEYIAKFLRSKPVQWFLEERIMKEQHIPKDNIKEVRVNRFPPKEQTKCREKRVLWGRYDVRECRIIIYPFPVSNKPDEPLSKDITVPKHLRDHVVKTLFEETLHAKYRSEYLKAKEKPIMPKVEEKMNKIHKRIKKQVDRYFREFEGWFLLKDSLFAQELKRNATTE